MVVRASPPSAKRRGEREEGAGGATVAVGRGLAARRSLGQVSAFQAWFSEDTVKLAIAAALAAFAATAAVAQPAAPSGVTPSANLALLNITAEGRSTRAPDLVSFNAGVVTRGKTAGEAMAANAQRMAQVVAALRRGGVAERDIQTSALSLQPQYHQPPRERPVRQPDGSVIEPPEPAPPRIIGYEARNTVTVRVRRVNDMGGILDTLVAAGANQVDGPYFTVDQPDAAGDEARADAMRTALRRAELYAREAGYRTARILTISEGGGYYPVARDIIVTGSVGGGAMAPPPPPVPVQPGEMAIGVSLSVQFALER